MTPSEQATLRPLSSAFGGVVVLIGAAALTGWAADVEILRAVAPGLSPMKVNTAVALVALGIAALAGGRTRARRGLSIALAAFVLLLSAITIAERAGGFDAGIDQLLWREQIVRGGRPLTPGRMALPTAIGLACVATAVLLQHARRRRAAASLLTLTAGLGAFVLLAYAFHDVELLRISDTNVAINTAAAFILISVAFAAAGSEATWLELLLDRTSYASRLSRRVMVLAIGAIVLVNLVRIIAQSEEAVRPAEGLALASVVLMAILGLIVVAFGVRLRKHELERLYHERALQLAEERFRLTALATNDIVYDWDVAGGRVWWSAAIERLGYDPETVEPTYEWWADRLHPEERELVEMDLRAAIASRDPHWALEYRLRRADGTWAYLFDRGYIVRDADGSPTRMIGTFTEISALKEAERVLRASEEKFRLVFENGTAGIAFWRLDGTVVEANDAYLAMTGYTRSDVAAGLVSWESVTPEEERELVTSVRARLETTRLCPPFERNYRRKDGSTIPVLVSASMLEGEGYDGVSVVVDMTERKQALDALRRSEERFRSLIEKSTDIISIISPEGIVQYESPSIEALLGYTPGEMVGKNPFDYMHPDDAAAAGDFFRRSLEVGAEDGRLEYRFAHKDGSWRWIESVARNLVSYPGIEGVVVNSRDITERRMWQTRLEQSDRLASLGRLGATVAHEFNNVLMGIQPFAEVLRRRAEADPSVAEACSHIEDSVRRGRRITQEILRFANAAEPSLAAVDVHEWLEQIGGEMKGLAGPRIDLTVDVSGGAVMLADRAQMTQAISNLMLNARDAMPAGGRITVSVDRTADGVFPNDALPDMSDFVHIAVRDDGVGIPLPLQAHIFEPLFTTKQGGTGLGLAVVHQIVTRHSGHISVESAAGEGTTFHLFIPRAKESCASPPTDRRERASGREGLRVLLVEDDQTVAAGISAMLEMEKFTPHVVHTGAEAWPAIAEFKPDVVVLDVGLPDIDGVDLYRQLAALYPRLPFLFSTGHGDVTRLAGLESERVALIQKPYSSDELIAGIHAILEPAG